MNDLDLHSRSQIPKKTCNLYSNSFVKWYAVAQAFAVVEHVSEITAKKSSKDGEYASF